MNAKKCDRCRAYYTVPTVDSKHSIVEVAYNNGMAQVSFYDLCPRCTEWLLKWLGNDDAEVPPVTA